MQVLSAADVRKALPMDAAIDAMRRAFAALSSGRANVPHRIHLPVESHEGVTLVMPAFVDDPRETTMAVKVVSLFDRNASRALPRIQAAVLAIEADTGRPTALVEGTTLTAIRTGAASGLATDLLARSDSRVAAILGAGVQARTQLEAVCTARSIETVWIYDPVSAATEAMIAEMAGAGPVPRDIRAARSPREALAAADVVCAATVSHTPAFDDADLKPGVHLNAIGSYQPHVQEVPPETVVRSLLVVDDRETVLEEPGDLIKPIRAGLIGPEHIHADLGELVLGLKPGREHDEQVTFFKSVGIAVQDALAVTTALEHAKRLGLGQEVPFL